MEDGKIFKQLLNDEMVVINQVIGLEKHFNNSLTYHCFKQTVTIDNKISAWLVVSYS